MFWYAQVLLLHSYGPSALYNTMHSAFCCASALLQQLRTFF
jgi:hypothetical protein